jgi:hypothetical protein
MKFIVALLGVSIALSPLTATRFMPGLGPTDVLLAVSICLFFVGSVLIARQRLAGVPSAPTNLGLVFQFWAFSLPVLAIATYFGVSEGQVKLQDATIQLAPYILIAFLAFGAYNLSARRDLIMILAQAYCLTSFLIASLYLFLFLSGSGQFFSYYRFLGLSENPNQLGLQAISTLVMALITYSGIKRRTTFTKLIYAGGSLLTVVYGIGCYSDSFRVAFSFLALAFLLYILYLGFRYHSILTLAVLLVIAGVLAYFSLELRELALQTWDETVAQMAEGDQDVDRFTLWQHGIEAGLDAPIIGNGAGAWSGFTRPFQGIEAHNSLIDWFSIAGFWGLAWIAIMLGRFGLWFRFDNSLPYLGVGTVLLFSMTGFVFRHPVFWLALITCFAAPRLTAPSFPIRGYSGAR